MQYNTQVDKLDCGVFVVQTMYKYFYDKWITLSDLKKDVNYNKYGISIFELSNLINRFGMKSEVLKGNFDSFKKLKLKNPIISIITNESYFHYVIVEKITSKNNVIYYDLILGKQKISLDKFEKIFCNIVILCNKDKKYKDDSISKIDLLDKKFYKENIWLSIISLIIFGLTFIGTYYIKIVLDQIAPLNNFNLLIWISFIFLIISLIKIFLNISLEFISSKLELKYQIILLEKYIKKISDVNWINIIHFDESMHLKNVEIIAQISSFKTKYVFSQVTQVFCLLISTIILVILNLQIFLFSFLSAGLLIITTFLFKNKFQEMETINIKHSLFFKNSFLNIIKGIDQYKIGNTKSILDKSFNDSLNKSIMNKIKSSHIGFLYYMVQSIIKTTFMFLIIIFSINQIWKDNLSMGQIFIFISIYNFFINAFYQVTSIFIEKPIIKQYIDTINSFFLLSDECNSNDKQKNIDIIKCVKMENLEFNYNDSNKKILVKNLQIDSNINLIGKNSIGKSTLIKILSTLIFSKNLSFNNKSLDYYNINSLREQVCYISNNEYLPTATVYEFLISSNKNNPDILLGNIEKYNLLTLFENMDVKLSTKIEEGGKNLSSGQKQFVTLMKLFSFNPSLILLDEAFENIDQDNLKLIFDQLRIHLKNKIVIEVSHRENYLYKGKEIDCELFNK
ncbi:MAG: ATP-binding cassette domain-containing protein [Mycoplasma sp.]|nr:ATP-binding cassette domain-containing protein [Mycoplasma sp.]